MEGTKEAESFVSFSRRVGEVNFKTIMEDIIYRIHVCMKYFR
jgi:hypothetical protein